jgi:hypothetical protein
LQDKNHPESEESETSCQFCSEIFSQTQNYFQHANDEHLEEIKENWIPCEECQLLFPDEMVNNLRLG